MQPITALTSSNFAFINGIDQRNTFPINNDGIFCFEFSIPLELKRCNISVLESSTRHYFWPCFVLIYLAPYFKYRWIIWLYMNTFYNPFRRILRKVYHKIWIRLICCMKYECAFKTLDIIFNYTHVIPRLGRYLPISLHWFKKIDYLRNSGTYLIFCSAV